MTQPISGEPPPGSSSAVIEARARVDWARTALLLLAGGVAVALHAATRGRHLHLPGHQGLFWMTVLAFARDASGMKWSASLAGLGAGVAAALPAFGFQDPLAVAGYLAPALVFDALSNHTVPWRFGSLRAGFLAAAALATKPLLQGLATIALGWPTAVATHGLACPLATHLAFGFVGGALGTFLWRRLTRPGQIS